MNKLCANSCFTGSFAIPELAVKHFQFSKINFGNPIEECEILQYYT